MPKPRPSQRKDAPSPQKARQILADKDIRGEPLTPKQQGFFGAVAAKARRASDPQDRGRRRTH